MEPATTYEWHYTLNGKRLGPVPEAALIELLESSGVVASTLVWREGLDDDWIPVSQTSLKWTRRKPPPLTGSAVGNGFVWCVAIAPVAGAPLESFIEPASGQAPHSLWFITPLLILSLCVIDSRVLKNAGHDTASFGGWSLLVPVYLFKRAKALKQSPAYFITWLCSFAVSFFM